VQTGHEISGAPGPRGGGARQTIVQRAATVTGCMKFVTTYSPILQCLASSLKGVGRALFETAMARARTLKVGALMIYASPFAEGFYSRLGAIRIGEGPFIYSPEIILPHFLFIVPAAKGFVAAGNL
jgi:hypothetical protein